MLSFKNRPATPATDPPPVSRLAPPPLSPAPGLGNVRTSGIQIADRADNVPFRRLAFWFGLALTFALFSVLPELILYNTGVNTYFLYFVGPPAILGALMTGGIRRTFRYRASYYVIAFFVWMVLATPFSSWPGGSLQRLADFSRASLIMLLVLGGLPVVWKEIRLVYYTIAAAAVVNLITAGFFTDTESERVSLLLRHGTISNPNDLAGHLLLVLPFVLFIAIDRKRNILLRVTLFGLIGYGVWIIVGTASRGALVAIVAAFLCFLYYAAARQRVVAILLGLLVAAVIPALVPRQAVVRLGTLFGEEHQEAGESAAARSYLFKKSITFTFEHPIFGVGPDQFANYEGKTRLLQGEHGRWQATHSSFTQVSSECGIPALIFYVAGLGSAILLVMRTHRYARLQGLDEVANACSCYLVAMVGFIVAITFLSNAYRFYYPSMIGLAVAMSAAAQKISTNGGGGAVDSPHGIAR
jgi:O-antigen ligase